MTRELTDGELPGEVVARLRNAAQPTVVDQARAHATWCEIVIELARIAAAEDDAAERRRDMATPCSTR